MAEPRNNIGNNRKLPKDQEKLNEAVRAKTTAETTSDLMNEAGLTVAAGEAMRQFGSKAVNPTASRVITGAGRFAGGGAYAPHLMAFGTGYAVGTELDRAFNYSGTLANVATLGKYTDPVSKDASKPMPAEYTELAKQGFNPQKPIIGRRGNQMGYEKLPDAPVSAPVAQQNNTNFEGSYLLPSGETMGLLKDGEKRIMTGEEVRAFNEATKNAPLVSGYQTEYDTGSGFKTDTPFEKDGVFMNRQALQEFAPSDPRVKPLGELTRDELVKRASDLQTAAKEAGATPTEAQEQSKNLVDQYYKEKEAQAPTKVPETSRGERAVANFEEFKRSGKEMTPEIAAQAELFAESMGLEFDQEKGYTNKFDPAILAEYKRKVEAGEVPRPQETTEQKFTRESREAREATEARRAAPTAPPRTEEETVRGTISVGGKQVPNSEANRILRDQENSLKEAGKRDGLRGAELRTFIRDGMKERADIAREETEAKEDREIKGIMDDLNISNAQARLEYNIQRLLPDAPERPSPNVISDFVKTAEDTYDLVFDPETHTFSTVEGRLLISDKEHPLNPNSQTYRNLKGLKGAEYLLAPPPDVLDNLDEYVQIAKENTDKKTKGKSFARSNDGRVYEITADGDVTHTGYSSN